MFDHFAGLVIKGLNIAKYCKENWYFKQGKYPFKDGIIFHYMKPIASKLYEEVCEASPAFHMLIEKPILQDI